jgi:chromosome condensin MukBEF ATPase and DNA-binding subunit MukB
MKILVLIILSIFVVSCTLRKDAQKTVKNEAAAVEPIVDPNYQYTRAISMINENPELKDKDKKKLVEVVNQYATKGHEIRMKRSQYRAVLVTEMLNSGSGKNPKVDEVKKNLKDLNDESTKQLGKFVRDFKYFSGNTAANFQPTMKEMSRGL